MVEKAGAVSVSRIVAGLAIIASIAAGWWGWWESRDVEHLSQSLDAANARIERLNKSLQTAQQQFLEAQRHTESAFQAAPRQAAETLQPVYSAPVAPPQQGSQVEETPESSVAPLRPRKQTERD